MYLYLELKVKVYKNCEKKTALQINNVNKKTINLNTSFGNAIFNNKCGQRIMSSLSMHSI